MFHPVNHSKPNEIIVCTILYTWIMDRSQVDSKNLGCGALAELLRNLKPAYWFAACLHLKFTAEVFHEGSSWRSTTTSSTKFLALDRVADGCKYISVRRSCYGSLRYLYNSKENMADVVEL